MAKRVGVHARLNREAFQDKAILSQVVRDLFKQAKANKGVKLLYPIIRSGQLSDDFINDTYAVMVTFTAFKKPRFVKS